MTASTASSRTGVGRKATMLLLGALIACLGVFAFSTQQAKAAPVSMNLNHGKLNLGFAFQGANILPAPSALPTVPTPTNLPDLWVARQQTVPAPGACLGNVGGPGPGGSCGLNPAFATVDGDLVGTALTITSTAGTPGAPSGFRFPIMVVANPLDGSPVPVSIAATGNVTGTYDAGTGALSMSGPIEARVLTGLASNPLGSYCALPLTGLTLSTTSNDDFPGVPFTAGFSGTGALTGTYNIVNDSTSVGGADCGTVNTVSKGLGSVWVSTDIATPPVCPEDTTGIPPNCVPDDCPAGQIGTPPNCTNPVALIGKVTVSGPSKAKRGKATAYKVKIPSTGTGDAAGVKLKVSGKGVSFNSTVGTIAKQTTRTVTVKLKFKKPGKIKVTFRVTSSNAGSKTVKKTVTVRK